MNPQTLFLYKLPVCWRRELSEFLAVNDHQEGEAPNEEAQECEKNEGTLKTQRIDHWKHSICKGEA